MDEFVEGFGLFLGENNVVMEFDLFKYDLNEDVMLYIGYDIFESLEINLVLLNYVFEEVLF